MKNPIKNQIEKTRKRSEDIAGSSRSAQSLMLVVQRSSRYAATAAATYPPTLVRRRGLEPPSPCGRYHLKVVRLPISPPARVGSINEKHIREKTSLRRSFYSFDSVSVAGVSIASDSTRASSAATGSAAFPPVEMLTNCIRRICRRISRAAFSRMW